MTAKRRPAKAHKQKDREPKGSRRTPVEKGTRKRPVILQQGGRYHGTPYRSTQSEYARTYSRNVRTIKRWRKEQKPLDDPDAMGEYLSPRGRKPVDPTPPAEDDFEEPSIVAPADEHDTESAAPIALDESFFAGLGFLAAIERLKKAERERAAAYVTAINRQMPAQIIQNRFREWIGLMEPLRKLAKDEPEIRKANDETIDKTEMEAAVAHMFNAYRQAARNLPSRAAGKLIGLKDHDAIIEILEAEVDVLFRALTKLSLEEAAAAKESEGAAV